jgi:8-oxo-dGTP pyrophosphatase MutT (NUDIX family)
MTEPDFVVAAVVMRDDAGRILVVRKAGTSRFMLPGGKIEPGESAAQTAVREAHEELGVVLDLDRVSLLGEWTASAANEDGRTVHGHVFEHPFVAGVTACAEIDEVLWLAPVQLASRDYIAHLLQSRVLPRYLEGD